MELDKALIAESLSELEALENETKLLLETIRGKPKIKKGAKITEKPESKTPKGKDGEKAKSKSKKKKSGDDSSGPSKSTREGFAETNRDGGRVTVEILDDASPDATPREDNEEHLQRMARDKEKLKNLQESERHFRKLQFDDERSRVILGADTFVPGPGLSVADVELEHIRLARIEDSYRKNRAAQESEVRAHKDFLASDRSALKIQSAFRGHIGRQKFTLTHRIKKMKDDDEYGDWIEVNDPATGDVWFYNKESGLSQWEKPAAMNRRKLVDPTKTDAAKLPQIGKDGRSKKRGKRSSDSVGKTDSPSGRGGNSKRGPLLSVSMALPSIDALTMGQQAVRPASSSGMARSGLSTPAGDELGTPAAGTLSPMKSKRSLSFRDGFQFDEEEGGEETAKKEVNGLLGIDKFSTAEMLTAPDGTFKPQLRTVVLDALLDTRFDSVATVLADTRWFENDEEPFATDGQRRRKRGGGGGGGDGGLSDIPLLKSATTSGRLLGNEDVSRQPLVAQLTFNKKKSKRGRPLDASDPNGSGGLLSQHLGATSSGSGKGGTSGGGAVQGPGDLTFKEVEHVGFEDQQSLEPMCFGCWSAGLQRKCELHTDGARLKPSQTMLLCRNWDLDVMRRRYRSEEIQELFLQREASLRFDAKHKKFSTVVEQRHPIYRFLLELNDTFKRRMVLFEKIKHWLLSMAEELRVGHLSESGADSARLMRIKRNAVNHSKLARFTVMNLSLLPTAPTTGRSWPERIAAVQYLFKHYDQALSNEVDLILVYPTPVPKFLYVPREYHLPLRKSIPMPKPAYTETDPYARVQPSNTFIPDDHYGAWLEKMSGAVTRDCIQAAKAQIKAFTPLTQQAIVSRTMQPVPNTIKAATTGRKPTPGNMAVGGLPLEMLVFQLICTWIPTQYGSFMVTEKGSVSPGISPEITISFNSLVMSPIVQHHIVRPLEHPLNYRRAPTITLNANIEPDGQKHFYGLNRPEQTGEQSSHGFRTTSWAPMLLTYIETDPQTFVPGQEVVSLNMPKANVSFTTHADYTYPFCEPSTRDNSTLDFFHLLLAGVVSSAKAQIFTALTVQEPGQFMNNYNMDAPMGHLVVSVYRSWAFTQRDTIQRFETDDGVPYWYHRKTGQTFWERPLFEDEEESPLRGGTMLDMEHPEEPSEMSRGSEGAKRRYNQGEFRGMMMNHIETKKDAMNRRKAAAATVGSARQRGIIPLIEGMESVVNHGQESVDIGSQFDFPKPNNSSIIPSVTQSGTTTASDSRPDTGTGAQGRDGGDLSHLHPNNLFNQSGQGNPSSAQYHGTPGSPGSGGDVRGTDTMGFEPNSRPGTTSTFAAGSRSRPVTSSMPATANSGAFMGLTGAFSTAPGTAAVPGTAGAMGTTGGQRAPVVGSNFDLEGSYVAESYPGSPGMTPGMTPGMSGMNPGMTPGMTPGMPGMTPGGQMGQPPVFNGMDMNMINNLSGMLNNMMNSMMLMDATNPQSMVTMGLGMGIALMQSGMAQNMASHQVIAQNQPHPLLLQQQQQQQHQQQYSASYVDGNSADFPTIGEEASSQISRESDSRQSQPLSRVSSSQAVSMLNNKNEPIGKVHPTQIFSADKSLDHTEEINQKLEVAQRIAQPLTTMEQARQLKVDSSKPTDTPDVAPPKNLTEELPSNAEAGLIEKKTMPLLAYPELSSQLPNGAHVPYTTRKPAGHGTSFVSKEEEVSQQMVPGTDNLRRTVMPLPVGFFEAIEAKHVAKQTADYLPQVPNLPQARHIGRVRPRSAALDWLMINFDPWSAGKNPLSTEFVPSLLEKADKFVAGGPAKAMESFDKMRQTTLQGAFVTTEDETGLAQQRAEISQAEHLAEDFKKVCSLCRHSKFADAEQLINQPDWHVPIDYQDDQGNTLLHIVAQNGNKRMVKLCLRRGAALDIQNLTGQTALHFAYGYGYADVGDYILSKGADDSIKNRDGLTCYEGLGAKELELL